jgi:protein-tyrosine phosphatase
MKNILVVCEGNICRSPMAQGLLASRLGTAQVGSAGLGALIGRPADPIAVDLLRERSIDISGHRAVQITSLICTAAQIILVMDVEQRQRLESMYPQVRGRVFRLGEYIKKDVPDPYRKPESAFREALALIEEGLQEWLTRIERL